MDLSVSGFQQNFQISQDQLLVGDEVIVLVDDDPAIRRPIKMFLEDHDLMVLEADSGASFLEILQTGAVAQVILDIGLPDINGKEMLPRIKEQCPDVGILMLTGVADLETALECLRRGADDYLAKPAHLSDIIRTVKKLLEKRRLLIQNRQYQEDLEKANFRIQLMHQLSLKMNSVYLNTVALDEILQAILVGITANEGLRFNRAFLAMFDEKREFLRGRVAIGPACREEAAMIWSELGEKQLDFLEIVTEIQACDKDGEVNRMIRTLEVPASATDHILIRSANERKSIKVVTGKAEECDPSALANFLGTDSFVVVPLYSPSRPLGVIIADNFITNHPISDSYVSALELFSSQASLAIEHSHLYMDMQKTIAELESLNYELDKNKDMLIEAERFSALGHMAAQMVHNIRNPITSIGGVARILAKKAKAEGLDTYILAMDKETTRLESILEDLFDFVSQTEIAKEKVSLLPLVRKTLMLLQSDTAKQNILVEIDFPAPDLEMVLDPRQIRKMLVHLLKNAVEAMPDGGRLSVRVTEENGLVSIAIINTGSSIPEEHINRAKEPFFTTKTYGTGMGLAMVEQVVTAHNGNFTIMNTGSGTEVVVRLPK